MNLSHILTIAKRELQSYFNAPLGYIFIAVFLVVSSGIFFQDFFLLNQSTLRGYFRILPFLYLFLLPAITMRLWAEERKLGTLESLLTAPLSPLEAVLGKFLASFVFLMIALLLSGVLPLVLFFIGQPDFGPVFGGYLGALFLGAAYLSVGLFISSLTDNQIIAFILSVLILSVLLAIGHDVFLQSLPQALVPFFKYLSLDLHFKSLLRGVLDSRDFAYYGSVIFLFLYFNVLSLHHRKWK